MRRINARTVDLTEQEMHCKDTFEGLLIAGSSIPEAAVAALNEYGLNRNRHAEFVAYLSDGTCEVVNHRVRVKQEWRLAPAPVLSAEEMRQRLGVTS